MNKTVTFLRGCYLNAGWDKGCSSKPRLKHPFCQISIIYCIFQEQPDAQLWLHFSLIIFAIFFSIKQLRCSTKCPTKLQSTVYCSPNSFRVWGFVSPSKNYHPDCNLPDYFKAPSWVDGHEDINSSHWGSGTSPVSSPIPYQAFGPHSHTKLSFPKRISPPERCHWGLWRTSGGLKMFWQTGRFTYSQKSL